MFHLFPLSPTKSGYFRMFKARSLPSEMIISKVKDEYRSIFSGTIFGFLHFLPILAIFGHFWGFSGGWGVFGSATES